MDITLASGKLLSGDMIVSTVLRSDLSPVPVSFEATIRANSVTTSELVEGAVITAGRDGYKFRIVKTKDAKATIGAQGNDLYGALSIIALFDACASVSFRRQTAVIKEGATLGGIYGACGSSVRIASDFTVKRFACLRGSVPSFEIAKVLQEEGGTLCMDGANLKFIRLGDIFKQDAAATLKADTTQDMVSGFLERHEVPSFFSLDKDGGFVFGNRTKVRAVGYMPRSDARVLMNMTRALIHRKVAQYQYAPTINAGQVIDIEGEKFAVVTAAHAYSSGTDGSGINAYSKFWLSTLEE